MMTMARTRKSALVLALAALTACGSTNDDSLSLIKQLPASFKKKETGAIVVSAEQMTQALSSTTAAVNLYAIESRKVQFLMVDIQRNGPYQSFGSASRQVIAMRDGMITSTRGFGGDLMSSDVDQLLPAVIGRAGSAQYVMRFLTPENITETRTYSCQLSSGGPISAELSAAFGSAEVINAKCSGEQGSFTNTYSVTHDGFILNSRQWLGETFGYVTSQSLRR